jgi:hypothetical protein
MGDVPAIWKRSPSQVFAKAEVQDDLFATFFPESDRFLELSRKRSQWKITVNCACPIAMVFLFNFFQSAKTKQQYY